jgi:hypothetical protein
MNITPTMTETHVQINKKNMCLQAGYMDLTWDATENSGRKRISKSRGAGVFVMAVGRILQASRSQMGV